MNIKKVDGFVTIHKKSGETTTMNPEQILGLILENQSLRKLNQLLSRQLEELTQHIEDNSVEISEVKLQNLLKDLGVVSE